MRTVAGFVWEEGLREVQEDDRILQARNTGLRILRRNLPAARVRSACIQGHEQGYGRRWEVIWSGRMGVEYACENSDRHVYRHQSSDRTSATHGVIEHTKFTL